MILNTIASTKNSKKLKEDERLEIEGSIEVLKNGDTKQRLDNFLNKKK